MGLHVGAEVTVSSEKDKFTCFTCLKTYKSQKALKLHKGTHDEKSHTCDVCHVSFHRKSMLTSHLICYSGERPHTCDRCGKSYKHISSLTNHTSSHGEKQSCDMCGKSFVYISGLRKHMKVCSQSDMPECSFCGKKYKYMKEHELYCESNPTSKEQFMCLQCNSVFKRKRYLTSHVRYAHSDHRYNCEKCSSTFAHRKTYNLHHSKCTGKWAVD